MIVYEGYKNKLKNKYFGLLKEREKGGEWEKFLDTILIELSGFNEDEKTINYYTDIYMYCIGIIFSGTFPKRT